MDIEKAELDVLVQHAQRQTKALENINWVLMAWFVLSLIAFGVWLIA